MPTEKAGCEGTATAAIYQNHLTRPRSYGLLRARKAEAEMTEATMMIAEGSPLIQRAIDEKVWGIASSIDIYDCDPEKIRSAAYIRQFVIDLCDLIEMKRFGETQVVHFGEDERVAGYSMVQLIETSLISAHFANLTNVTYLDVFSCKPYDPDVVAEFACNYFGGEQANLNVTLRQ